MKKTNTLLVIFCLVILIVIIYGSLRLSGWIILDSPANIERIIQKISSDGNSTEFLITLNLEANVNEKVLGIREHVNTTACSEIYDISDEGVLKFDNTIEWIFVNQSTGLNAPELKDRNLSYKIRHEKCLEEEY